MLPKINVDSATLKSIRYSAPSDYLPRANATKQPMLSTVYLCRATDCVTDGAIITTPSAMRGGLYYESPW
jgi:hypothetical protein